MSTACLLRPAARGGFPWESAARSYSRSIGSVWVAAHGAYLVDEHGRQFLDLLSGAGALALGHHHPVVEAALDRARSHPATFLDMRTALEEEFASCLQSILPMSGAEVRMQFCGPTGSDAVEAAIKLARIATGRQAIIAFQGSYHGMSQGALAVTSKRSVRDRGLWGAQPVTFCPFPYPKGFPSPFRTDEAARAFSLAQLELQLADDHSGLQPVAAVILEPIQGEGGCIVPPAGFLREVERMCRQHGALLIVDEVQTGMGRTGTWFASSAEDVEPDILCLSKGVGGGYPMALIAYRAELDCFRTGEHIGTFRGQALAMAAGLATMRYIRDHDLLARVATRGAEARAALEQLLGEHPEFDAQVRGRGYMLGFEIGGPDGGRIAKLIQRLLWRGQVIVETGGRRSAVVRLLPPLTLSDAQWEAFLRKLSSVLCRLSRYLAGRVSTS